MIKNIRHSGIVVSNLQSALYFYQDLLGLKIVTEGKLEQYDTLKLLGIADTVLHYVKLCPADPSSLLELYYFESEKVRNGYFGSEEDEWQRFDLNHISFTVDNIDELHAKLEEAGVSIHSEPSIDDQCRHKIFFCRDYDDNLLELVQVLT